MEFTKRSPEAQLAYVKWCKEHKAKGNNVLYNQHTGIAKAYDNNSGKLVDQWDDKNPTINEDLSTPSFTGDSSAIQSALSAWVSLVSAVEYIKSLSAENKKVIFATTVGMLSSELDQINSPAQTAAAQFALPQAAPTVPPVVPVQAPTSVTTVEPALEISVEEEEEEEEEELTEGKKFFKLMEWIEEGNKLGIEKIVAKKDNKDVGTWNLKEGEEGMGWFDDAKAEEDEEEEESTEEVETPPAAEETPSAPEEKKEDQKVVDLTTPPAPEEKKEVKESKVYDDRFSQKRILELSGVKVRF